MPPRSLPQRQSRAPRFCVTSIPVPPRAMELDIRQRNERPAGEPHAPESIGNGERVSDRWFSAKMRKHRTEEPDEHDRVPLVNSTQPSAARATKRSLPDTSPAPRSNRADRPTRCQEWRAAADSMRCWAKRSRTTSVAGESQVSTPVQVASSATISTCTSGESSTSAIGITPSAHHQIASGG